MHGDIRVNERLIDIEHVSDCVRDALVCLMRNKEIYVFGFQAGLAKHVARNL
jgi:hypothetical protein